MQAWCNNSILFVTKIIYVTKCYNFRKNSKNICANSKILAPNVYCWKLIPFLSKENPSLESILFPLESLLLLVLGCSIGPPLHVYYSIARPLLFFSFVAPLVPCVLLAFLLLVPWSSSTTVALILSLILSYLPQFFFLCHFAYSFWCLNSSFNFYYRWMRFYFYLYMH